MSGTTLRKCAPVPSRAPASSSQAGGAGLPGSPRVRKAVSSAKLAAYGSQDHQVRFSPRS